MGRGRGLQYKVSVGCTSRRSGRVQSPDCCTGSLSLYLLRLLTTCSKVAATFVCLPPPLASPSFCCATVFFGLKFWNLLLLNILLIMLRTCILNSVIILIVAPTVYFDILRTCSVFECCSYFEGCCYRIFLYLGTGLIFWMMLLPYILMMHRTYIWILHSYIKC